MVGGAGLNDLDIPIHFYSFIPLKWSIRPEMQRNIFHWTISFKKDGITMNHILLFNISELENRGPSPASVNLLGRSPTDAVEIFGHLHICQGLVGLWNSQTRIHFYSILLINQIRRFNYWVQFFLHKSMVEVRLLRGRSLYKFSEEQNVFQVCQFKLIPKHQMETFPSQAAAQSWLVSELMAMPEIWSVWAESSATWLQPLLSCWCL